MLLKVFPYKDGVRFVERDKLGPRYFGPFEVIERVGKMDYRLRLFLELSGVHEVFHNCNLRKC